MTEQSLAELIGADRIEDALQLALQHRTVWVEEQLEYDVLDRLEERASVFLQRWVTALPPLEGLQAADWASSHYVLSLVHLEHARGTGARMLLGAQDEAVSVLARTMRQVGMFADGPDAELDPSVEQRLEAYAEQVEAMSFVFVPLEPDGD